MTTDADYTGRRDAPQVVCIFPWLDINGILFYNQESDVMLVRCFAAHRNSCSIHGKKPCFCVQCDLKA